MGHQITRKDLYGKSERILASTTEGKGKTLEMITEIKQKVVTNTYIVTNKSNGGEQHEVKIVTPHLNIAIDVYNEI